MVSAAGYADSPATTRVSVDSAGAESDDRSEQPSISAGGCFVAFQSDASNMVAGDNYGRADVFVHGRGMHTTARVSVGLAGNIFTCAWVQASS